MNNTTTAKSECRCLIRHAISVTERKAAVDTLNYSRSIGDTVGIMVGMAILGECPSAK